MDFTWLDQISGSEQPLIFTQADLCDAMQEHEQSVEPPPVLTGEALCELLVEVFSTHQISPVCYEVIAQRIQDRYITPCIGVSPKVSMAWTDILHALRELVKEWYHYSFDPGQGWKPVWELRKKAEELLGKDALTK